MQYLILFPISVLLLIFCKFTLSSNVYSFLRYGLFREYFDLRSNLTELMAQRERQMTEFHSHRYNRYTIDRRSYLNLSSLEFHRIYDNIWPVLIKDLIFKLEVSSLLQKPELVKLYGNEQVSVVISKNGLLSGRESRRMTINNFAELISSFSAENKSWAYLSDELFIRNHSDLAHSLPNMQPFTNPNLFEDVFFKPFQPPEALLLWGSAGSRSSMHVDPCNWTGISWLMSGRKRWRLLPPAQAPHNLVSKFQLSGSFPLPCYQYTTFSDAFSDAEYSEEWKKYGMDVDQDAGEMLVIPPGWFHQAFNVDESLAISTSLMNSANFREVLVELAKVGSFSQVPYQILTKIKTNPFMVTKTLLQHVNLRTIRNSENAWHLLKAI